jgi:hypothetical protein
MTRNLVRTVTVALVLGAFAAPTAVARPADLAGVHTQRSTDPGEFPVRPVLDRPSTPASSRPAVPLAPADHSVDWVRIGIGIAGGLLSVGAVAVLAGHRRGPSRARVAA